MNTKAMTTTKPEPTPQLLNCPFCNTPARSCRVGEDDCSYHSVYCPRCHGSQGVPYCGVDGETEEECVAIWNTRAADPRLIAERDEARAERDAALSRARAAESEIDQLLTSKEELRQQNDAYEGAEIVHFALVKEIKADRDSALARLRECEALLRKLETDYDHPWPDDESAGDKSYREGMLAEIRKALRTEPKP